MMKTQSELQREVVVGPHRLPGFLVIPEQASGLVLFAHGSGSSRLSGRNQFVARTLHQARIATLLFDLLDEIEADDRSKVFDIELLAERLQEAADWIKRQPETKGLELGYFGASTGAAAALVAAAQSPERIRAVVSRGGRPDLAENHLAKVRAPTLLIVGGDDEPVVSLNRAAYSRLRCPKELAIVPGATHLFPEPGTLDEVARLASDWFFTHFANRSDRKELAEVDESDPPYRSGCLFHDREEAGRQLAGPLRKLKLHDPLVVGIPRGGVATGAAVARELGAELDIVLTRKLRAPYQPELAVGAIGEDGNVYLSEDADQIPGVTDAYLAEEREYQLKEIRRRQRLFRPIRPSAPISGRSVIVTDDGIATGSTMIAALEVLKAQNPHELIVAVPVAPPHRLEPIRSRCDRFVSLHTPEIFWAVGQFYQHFEPVEDSQVADLLREFAAAAEIVR